MGGHTYIHAVTIHDLQTSGVEGLVTIVTVVLAAVLFATLFAVTVSVGSSFRRSGFLVTKNSTRKSFGGLARRRVRALGGSPLVQRANTQLFLKVKAKSTFHGARIRIDCVSTRRMGRCFYAPARKRHPGRKDGRTVASAQILGLLKMRPGVNAGFAIACRVKKNRSRPGAIARRFILSN